MYPLGINLLHCYSLGSAAREVRVYRGYAKGIGGNELANHTSCATY